ncbi:hypothetical protein AD998_10255 [bacterium 336/3]|nr:hypothetical protein AD998_10255 [bacterium 336/3]
MIYILLNWLNALFLTYTFGELFYLGLKKITKTNIIIAKPVIIMLGFVVLNFLTDIIAVFAPINIFTQGIIEILACIIFFILWKTRNITLNIKNLNTTWLEKIFYLLYGYIFIFVCVRCFYPTSHYDEGLYYIQHVRWIQNYGFVPGLANLHLRLGFNSNWHNLATLFDYPFLSKNFFNDLNGFLFLIFGAYCWTGIIQLFSKKYTLIALLKIFAFVSLIYPNPYFFSAHNGIFINTISPDWASFIFVATTFILFIESYEKTNAEYPFYLFLIVIFSTYCFSIKIANIAITGLVLYAVIWLWMKKMYKLLLLLLAVAFISIIPWLISNIILSGCILFPVSFLQIGVLDWAVPKHIVESFAYETKTWAKTGGAIEVYNKLTFKELIIYWYHKQEAWLKIFYPVIIMGFFILILFLCYELIRLKNRFLRMYGSIIPILLSNILGIVFWFFTAPDFRFGAIYIIFIGILSISLFIQKIKNINYVKVIIVVVGIIYIIPALTLNDIWGIFSHVDFPTIPSTGIQLKENIYIPLQTDQCFDAKLPCTPDTELVKGRVLLRKENDLSKGFILK